MNRLKKNIEKRKFARLKAYHLVKFKQLTEPQGEPQIAAIRDISGGGVCLISDKELKSGSSIQLYINFPHISMPIPSLAKVTWVKKLPKSKKFESGLQFVEIEDSMRKEIIKSVEDVIRISYE
jgi:c-di-GMP-binding flagellar brake protein YcgR